MPVKINKQPQPQTPKGAKDEFFNNPNIRRDKIRTQIFNNPKNIREKESNNYKESRVSLFSQTIRRRLLDTLGLANHSRRGNGLLLKTTITWQSMTKDVTQVSAKENSLHERDI